MNKINGIIIVVCLIAVALLAVLILGYKNEKGFSEIYFENPQNLPKEIEANKDYYFSFNIHNLEGRREDYSYEVVKEFNGREEIISRDRIRLGDKEIKKTDVRFSIKEYEKVKISVRLLSKKQEIHFWVDVK